MNTILTWITMDKYWHQNSFIQLLLFYSVHYKKYRVTKVHSVQKAVFSHIHTNHIQQECFWGSNTNPFRGFITKLWRIYCT